MTKTKYLAAYHILWTLISQFKPKKSVDPFFCTAQNTSLVKFKAFSEFLHFSLENKHLSVTKN